jgi:signal transduction histidine kinase
MSDVDLSEIIEGASLNFEPVAFEKGVLIETQIDNGMILRGNALQLNQLAHILIDNAVKYSSPDSVIKIRLCKKGDSVEFSVNNRGNVIGENELEHIFDRFYRTDSSRNSKQGGSGIGLSIVKKIIEDHGGYIWATSHEGEGTCMHFVLRKFIDYADGSDTVTVEHETE